MGEQEKVRGRSMKIRRKKGTRKGLESYLRDCCSMYLRVYVMFNYDSV
jgi:hypothetical protein